MAWTIPRTWVSGEIVTAANMNTHVRDNLLAISGAWTSFSSTWSGTLGNGTKTCAYTRIGRTIHYRILVLWGSSTSHPAALQSFTLPVAESAAISFNTHPFGIASAFDASVGGTVQASFVLLLSAQTVCVVTSPASLYTNLVPMTWTTGDIVYLTGTYEANTD